MSRQTQYQRKATAKSINLHTLYRTYSHKSSFLLVPAIAVVGIMALVSAFFLISDFSANSYAIDDPNDDMIDDQHYVSLSVSDANLSFTPSGSSTVNSKQVNITLSTNVQLALNSIYLQQIIPTLYIKTVILPAPALPSNQPAPLQLLPACPLTLGAIL